jgi:hypothetical protein
MAFGTFEYYTYGQWYMTGVSGTPGVPLYDQDGPGQVGTDKGMRIEFTLNTADTFTASMIPLDNPGAAFTHSGMLVTDRDGNPDNGDDGLLSGLPLDWIEFEFYNSDSDFYPQVVTENPSAVFPPGTLALTDYNDNGQVDAADYPVWRKMNNTGFDLANEEPSTSPGNVTDADYDEWKERYGSITPRATDFYIRSIEIVGPGGSSAGVPEPGAFVLFATAATGLMPLTLRRYRPRLKRVD